jgi:hypothetical protein
MSAKRKEPLLVFEHEIELQSRMFEATPLAIVRMFLECFDSSGRQAFLVPEHVLAALAKRFRALMDGDVKSLDAAFGGRVRRQRNQLVESGRQYSVSWAVATAIEDVRAEPVSERGNGTPFEVAVERVAEEFGLNVENVRRIYKAAATG